MPERQVSLFGPRAHFYECPRWRHGRWWVSDMRGRVVYSFSESGERRVELEIDRPGGLGWMPDGKLLVVSMDAKTLLKIGPVGNIEARTDLSSLCGDIDGFCNDMVVDAAGNAYVGFDADFHKYGPDAELGKIILVPASGPPHVVAEGLAFPNGIMFSPDGTILIVAETLKPRLSAFAIAADGSLGPRYIWASLDPLNDERGSGGRTIGPSFWPDGCSMDAEGYAWVADAHASCLRVAPGGAVVDALFLPTSMRAFACGLGGRDGRTLLICGAMADVADRTTCKSAQLFTAQVPVGAA